MEDFSSSDIGIRKKFLMESFSGNVNDQNFFLNKLDLGGFLRKKSLFEQIYRPEPKNLGNPKFSEEHCFILHLHFLYVTKIKLVH